MGEGCGCGLAVLKLSRRTQVGSWMWLGRFGREGNTAAAAAAFADRMKSITDQIATKAAGDGG